MSYLFEEEDTVLKIGVNRHIKIEAFVNKFGHKHDYETLINHKNTDEKWKEVFDWMKDKGILD